MTPEERARTIAYLDLAEGRGDVPLLGDDGVRELLASSRRIAVIGASDRPGRASGDVFRHLTSVGFDCVPVNPRAQAVAGVPACAAHAQEAVEVGAKCLWLQLGIVDWEAARIAHDAGLAVVMDRCLSVEWRRLGRRPLEER